MLHASAQAAGALRPAARASQRSTPVCTGAPLGAWGAAAPVPKIRRWAWVPHKSGARGGYKICRRGNQVPPPAAGRGGSVRTPCRAGQGRVTPQGNRTSPCARRADVAHHRQARTAAQAARAPKNPSYAIELLVPHDPSLAGHYAAHSTLLRHMRCLSKRHAFPASNLRKQTDNGATCTQAPPCTSTR